MNTINLFQGLTTDSKKRGLDISSKNRMLPHYPLGGTRDMVEMQGTTINWYVQLKFFQ